MCSARLKTVPAPISASGGGKLKATDVLYNDILSYIKAINVGWSHDLVDTAGSRFVTTLRDVLRYIDPHHDKIKDRGGKISTRLSHFVRTTIGRERR